MDKSSARQGRDWVQGLGDKYCAFLLVTAGIAGMTVIWVTVVHVMSWR